MKSKKMATTASAYGQGTTLERFPMKHLNIRKNEDLMPCPRRPPKKKSD